MTTVLLVHGAYHGAWCWERVASGLEAQGISVRAVDLPGHGTCARPVGNLDEDAAVVQEAVLACEGPVIVCGHSFGGAVVTQGVPKDPRVAHLVFLAAIVPDVAQSVAEAMGADAVRAFFGDAGAPAPTGHRVDPARAHEIFYHDCDPESARWAADQLGPESTVAMLTPLSQAAWRDHASTYVVCSDDRAILPEAQERMSGRCDAVLRWPVGHSPMLNRPDLLIELLADLAEGHD